MVPYQVGLSPRWVYPNQLDLQRLLPLVGPAHGELARCDHMLSAVPNTGELLAPLITQEAVCCASRIEGAQATFAEVLRVRQPKRPSARKRRQAHP